MEEFYGKLLCWKDYKKKKDKDLMVLKDSAEKIVEKTQKEKRGDPVYLAS